MTWDPETLRQLADELEAEAKHAQSVAESHASAATHNRACWHERYKLLEAKVKLFRARAVQAEKARVPA